MVSKQTSDYTSPALCTYCIFLGHNTSLSQDCRGTGTEQGMENTVLAFHNYVSRGHMTM